MTRERPKAPEQTADSVSNKGLIPMCADLPDNIPTGISFIQENLLFKASNAAHSDMFYKTLHFRTKNGFDFLA